MCIFGFDSPILLIITYWILMQLFLRVTNDNFKCDNALLPKTIRSIYWLLYWSSHTIINNYFKTFSIYYGQCIYTTEPQYKRVDDRRFNTTVVWYFAKHKALRTPKKSGGQSQPTYTNSLSSEVTFIFSATSAGVVPWPNFKGQIAPPYLTLTSPVEWSLNVKPRFTNS